MLKLRQLVEQRCLQVTDHVLRELKVRRHLEISLGEPSIPGVENFTPLEHGHNPKFIPLYFAVHEHLLIMHAFRQKMNRVCIGEPNVPCAKWGKGILPKLHRFPDGAAIQLSNTMINPCPSFNVLIWIVWHGISEGAVQTDCLAIPNICAPRVCYYPQIHGHWIQSG